MALFDDKGVMQLMLRMKSLSKLSFAISLVFFFGASAMGQRTAKSRPDGDARFGPVMRAYLGYLRNEQEVVDDRISRREITSEYYRRNSNRIRALRQMATRLVTQTGNDYVPELEAVTVDEFGTLFETPQNPRNFHLNGVVMNTFRYLGVANAGEVFYVFARLDPYEQAALMEKKPAETAAPNTNNSSANTATGQRVGQSRPRRSVPQ